jgi:Protein of unknown function DUF262/Restriction Enzyme Adenine Methylase Associated/Protein of unknown function (DUF1524)
MKTPKHSLRKIVNFLNNPDEDGGFWLPNIQRAFVWSEEQICRLFDSILREYPISTLLIWRTNSNIRRRKFIDNFQPIHRMRLSDFYVPDDTRRKCLVLDGQQRLQSLFIGLKGSYAGRELFFNVLSGEVAAPDDVKDKFAFIDPGAASFPWIKFKDLVFSDGNSFTHTNRIVELAGTDLSDKEKERIGQNVAIVFKAFHSDDGIGYQELDSTENPSLYTEDDVVEVFIRANSGGTRLGKSDLLFALLTSTWDSANDEMEELLQKLNERGFAFTRDFVLKTCLTLLDHGARYEVEKFRKAGVREEIESKWDNIADSIKEVLDFIIGKTFIRCDKALPSYLVLIPLVYVRYHFPHAWRQARDLDSYLLRSSLAGAFSGTPDQLIDNLVAELRVSQAFNLDEVFGVVRSEGRSLEVTEERLWNMGYGSDSIHLLFNLWYRGFNYTPAYVNSLPQVDHIFPQSLLRTVKERNPSTGTMNVMRYRERDRNQLSNCMLLTAQENGAGGKSSTPPDEWFVGERSNESYLDMHLIPKDPSLWKLERFEDFIDERKKLIAEKFKFLLISPERQISLQSFVQSLTEREKNIAKLIDAGVLPELSPMVLTYRGQEFSGIAHRDGIELTDGMVYSPSAAAIRCYAKTGSTRSSENGWAVWKDAGGRSLNDLLERLSRVSIGQDTAAA